MSQKEENNNAPNKKSIAIIGMSGVFPESDSVEHFWEKLENQESLIKDIPEDHDPKASIQPKRGAFVKNLQGFDAKLFHIIGKEAKYMTPQQRKLLMSVWHLFEDACILPSSLKNKKVAVIVGKEVNPYMEYLTKAPITAYSCLGMAQTYLPNRISNYFNLKGPSYCINTSCSSGLTALHHGKKMLQSGEVDYAIVAGVSLIYGEEWTRSFFGGSQSMGLMSTTEDGGSPFQEKASGFTPSEGVVSLLLKRGDEAIDDKDNIHAYVIGSESSHVGGNGNIAFPDSGQQSKAIVAAYEDAKIDPATVTHIEAHAASSILADSQEIKAFKLADRHFGKALGKETAKPCKISSLKPNIGHMHAASGLASVIRLIYSFKTKKKLGIKNFEALSKEIKLEKTRYYMSAETEEWPRLIDDKKQEIPRRGAVNNSGGGGNVIHAIFEEYIPLKENASAEKLRDGVFFLALSCTEVSQFVPYAERIKNFLEKNMGCNEQQLEYQYLTSRKELNQRIVFRYKTIDDLIGKLTKFTKSEGKRGYYVNGNHKEELSLNEIFLKNGKVVEFLNDLNEKQDKSFLFDLWTKGYEAPIHKYYENLSIPKLSLPCYPFNLQDYWLDIYSNKGIEAGEAINDKEVEVVTESITKKENTTEISTSEPMIIQKEVEGLLMKTVSELLDVSVDNISTEEEIGDYGFNSVGLTEFANVLSEYYAIKVLPTLFYNYPTIQKLTAFLMEDHREALERKHQVAPKSTITTAVEQTEVAPVMAKDAKKAFAACKKESCAVRALAKKSNEPIAIIGMSGRFPGSPDVNTFWENIKTNKDLVTEIPKDRWNWKDYYGEATEEKRKTTAKWGGFIEDIDKFDPLHFNISPKEAELMDPQHRLAIEEAYHALEDAGVNPKSLSGTNTGVFVGSYFDDYATLIDRSRITDSQVITGLSQSMVANRISYLLDLNGPSETIDTACSSSLVAIKRGIEKIQRGECNVVIAGGVSLVLMPDLLFPLSQAGFLSKEGRCKTFDQSANGYVRGEGVGMVVLKRLSQAKADGDQIHAVIRGASENHGGKANTLTSPNPNAQKELLIKAYKSAKVDPSQVGYIEAHGTGTPLGDPIETEGLKLAFKALYKDNNKALPTTAHIRLGSVKTNIGHLEPAAGIAGIIKVVQSLKHRTIPGNPHLKQPNEYLDLDNSPFQLQRETTPWPVENGQSRVAGISSFGAGGSNAHIVLEEYVSQYKAYEGRGTTVVVLSAKNKARLKEQVQNLLDHINEKTSENVYDVAYTLQMGREAMEERLAISVNDLQELKVALENYLEGQMDGFLEGNTRKSNASVDSKQLQIAIRGLDLRTLAEYWVKGVTIDWKQLYEKGNKPKILSLPTYPFARQRYWIPETIVQMVEEPKSKSIIENTGPDKTIGLYEETWKTTSIASNVLPDGTVLILNANNENSTLVSALKQRINQAIVVNPLKLEIVPFESVNAVIDLGTTSATDYTWVEILQKVIDASKQEKINLVQVSRQGKIAIGKGLYQTLGAEYGKVSSICLELDDDSTMESDIEAILNILPNIPSSVRVRYGNRKWEIPSLKPIVLNTEAKIIGPVLITGGTRGLGMAYAKHLVKNHQVKQLVLLGRQGFPPKEEWKTYVKEENVLTQKIKDIQYLENCGAQVKLISPSLMDKQALEKSLSQIKGEWGSIKGLVHCAGLVDMETPAFIRKSIETIKKLQEPKVLGLDNLYEVLKAHDVDFGILFSSISALVPHLGAGQCDYAMCNAYLESFAAMHHKEGYRSIQWPSWKETGMGEVTEGIYRDLGLLSLTNDEGAKIIDQVIGLEKEDGIPTIAPMVYNELEFSVDNLLEIPKQATQVSVEVTKTNSSEVSTWVTVQISEALKLPADIMELDIPFQEYGVDSILLADLVKQLEKQLGGNVSLSPSIILEHPTVGMLSEYLTEHYNDALSNVLDKKIASRNDVIETENQVVPNAVSDSIQKANPNEPIAIIGMACHFPEANNVGAYWDNLEKGRDSIKEVPSSRWDVDAYYSETKEQGKSYSKWGAFLDNIEDFDPEYFKIPEALASQLDPLERQWLEVSAEAIEDAGYDKKALWGKSVGVYAGARVGNFKHKLTDLHKDFIVGTGQNFITAHLAHIYNLKGPNMVIDTACSSSLTAMDLAVKSLRQGETEMALAGGVDILLDEGHFVGLSIAEVLSKDGRTKAFDEKADGTGLGEGCGVLLLKRLEDAIADGDKIYSVIEGTAVNNDGSTMGITTPNPKAQQELLEIAIDNGQIDRSTISYIEAHGTGTLIGDPIELKGITTVLSKSNVKDQKCAVGSVKTNIGHLMSAAGVAGVIKTALSVCAGQLPPTLNCDTPNPRFDFSNSPVYPVRTLQDWEGVNGIRRAGISAFGLGGNNAHVILSNEGIPESNKINKPFNKTNIQFNRKRHWPETKKTTKAKVKEEMVAKGVKEIVAVKNKDVSAKSMATYFDMDKKKEGAEWTFTLDMNNDHYVLRDHRVHGVSIVPGVTYLDLVLRCSKELFGRTFELSRIIFTEPLATDETYNRRIEVRFRKGMHSISDVMVRSKRLNLDGNAYGEWNKHVSCRLNTMKNETRSKLDIRSFKVTSDQKIDMSDVYKSARSVDIVHGEFMETLGVVYQKGREELMQLHLSDLSTSYLDRFYLSPAFLDGATFSGSSFHAITQNQVSYIPFSIERFKAYGTLPSTIYVYSKHKEEKYDEPSEVIKSDISIYDENGVLLVEFKNLAIKRIRHAGLITNLLQENKDNVLQA